MRRHPDRGGAGAGDETFRVRFVVQRDRGPYVAAARDDGVRPQGDLVEAVRAQRGGRVVLVFQHADAPPRAEREVEARGDREDEELLRVVLVALAVEGG